MRTDDPPLPAEKRFLSLAGGAWSPTSTNNAITLRTKFCAGISATFFALSPALNAAFISDESETNNDTINKVALNGALSLGGSMLAMGFLVRSRRREAETISRHHTYMVIDKQPNPGTITAPATLAKVIELQIPTNPAPDLLGKVCYPMHPFAGSLPMLIGAFSATALTVNSVAQQERRHQLAKIVSGEWVITDSGTATGIFQQGETQRLLEMERSAKEPARAPR